MSEDTHHACSQVFWRGKAIETLTREELLEALRLIAIEYDVMHQRVTELSRTGFSRTGWSLERRAPSNDPFISPGDRS